MDILIVEDDPTIRALLTEMLEDDGYSVFGVANGWDALSQLRDSREPPRVIILDLMMPVVNGWQFRQIQQSHAGWTSIPVLVLSAFTDVHDKARAIGAADVITKPIDHTLLLETVARYCSPSGQRNGA